MTPYYDTLEGIKTYLRDGLVGLHRLRKHRHQAAQRQENLGEWVLLGKFVLDSAGQFFALSFREDEQRFCDEDVVTKHAAFAPSPKYMRVSMSGDPLPPLDDVCARCGEGWTIHNCSEVVKNDGVLMEGVRAFHTKCYEYLLYEDTKKLFAQIFFDAGYVCPLRAVPNLYGSERYHGPWFIADTKFGDIRIGWRKRVIEIDWSKSTLGDQMALFKDEDCTKTPTLIHAWGAKKATEFLRRLHVAKAEEIRNPTLSAVKVLTGRISTTRETP